MDEIIVTYTPYFAIMRFYAGQNNDAAVVRAAQVLRAADYLLTAEYRHDVLGNGNHCYLVWTRATNTPALGAPSEGATWVDATDAEPAVDSTINAVLVTYSNQCGLLRFFGSSDNDVALALASDVMLEVAYVLDGHYQSVVLDNSGRLYMAWTRPENDPLDPPEIDNVTWNGELA